MSRHLFVAVAALLLAACGDDPSPGECDPTQFDCTPITPPSTCMDDTTDENCEPTTPEPPVYVPTKDEMREAGVVFLGDEDFNGFSQTRELPSSQNPTGDELTDFTSLLFWADAHYMDCVDRTNPNPNYRSKCVNRRALGTFGSKEFDSDWILHENGIGPLRAAMEAGSFCLMEVNEWSTSGRDVPQARLYDYAAGQLTIHSPPSVDRAWMCIETPYGAGWLYLEGNRSIEGDRSVTLREPRAERTCHPDLDWISFTNWGAARSDWSPPSAIAYTVGTRYADFLPVSECAPWGTAKVHPPYAR